MCEREAAKQWKKETKCESIIAAIGSNTLSGISI